MNRREFLQALGVVVPALSIPVVEQTTNNREYHPETDRVVYEMPVDDELAWSWVSAPLASRSSSGSYIICASTVA